MGISNIHKPNWPEAGANNWFEIGVNDLSPQKCLETKVNIYIN